jgi:hypothetical protein
VAKSLPNTMATCLSYPIQYSRDNPFAALGRKDDDNGGADDERNEEGIGIDEIVGAAGNFSNSTGDSGVGANGNECNGVLMAGFAFPKGRNKSRKKFVGTNASRTMSRLEMADAHRGGSRRKMEDLENRMAPHP